MEINVLIQKQCKIIPWKEYNNIWEEHTLLFLNHRGLNSDISPFLIIYVCVCVCVPMQCWKLGEGTKSCALGLTSVVIT